MRLFVALEIPAAVRDNLAALLHGFQTLSAGLADKRPHWVRPENLHVTLKFIGETASATLGGIRAALSQVRSDAEIELQFRGLGFFPDEKRPKVLWAGVNASPNLSSLAGDIDRALVTEGIAPEKRAFSPHLTLARFEPPGLHETLRAAVQKGSTREFGSFQAREFQLIESKLKPSGAEYTTLASFPFTMEL
ncbi:MAG: RNA 2',3'-cyclic phosphodiesterase [Candidatus Acidiferrum sp.]